MLYSLAMISRFFDNWTTQLRKGLLEFCVLSAIRAGRVYGYDIVKQLRAIDGLVIGEGTIYPILSRFKREGLVRTSIEESQEGPPRKYYELTARGAKALAQMDARWEVMKRGIDTLKEKGQ